MNDLILAKMREGDWGEVVRLMRAEYGGSPDPAPATPKGEPKEMPFRERFETVRVTPRTVADSVVEENGRFSGITFEGERYKPSRRFLKGLAQRMKVSRPYITKVLHQDVNFSFRTAAKLANALKMDFLPELRPQETADELPA